MDEVTKANIFKMQGRFSAIEVALRALIADANNPDGVRAEIRAKTEPTLRMLAVSESDDLILLAGSMRETMDAILDMG